MVHEEAQPVEMNEAKVANAVRHTLWTAQTENRLIAGLKPAIDTLSEIPEEALFCFIAPAKKEDSASHINEVLLKAFCYENDIYTIEVSLKFSIWFISFEKLLHDRPSCLNSDI